MSKIYLHIGMPKTGTSSLQAFLGLNRKLLLKKGVDFPDGGDFLLLRWIPGVHNGLWTRYTYNKPEFQKLCDQTYKLCENSPIVLFSDEGVFHSYIKGREKVRGLAENARAHGHSLEIIMYLRRQDEFLMSNWAQIVKVRSPKSFDEWMAKRRSDGDEADYYEYLSNLAEDVGKEHLHVRIYEKSRFTSGERTIFSDFLEILGIDDLTGFEYPERMKNVSLQDIYLETKQRLNRDPRFQINKGVAEEEDDAYRMATDVKDILLNLQEEARENGTLKNRKPMSSAQCRELLKEYEERNEKTAAEFLGLAPGTPLFSEEPKGEWDKASYTDDEVFDVMAETLMRLEQRYITQRTDYRKLKEQTRLKNIPAFAAGRLMDHFKK